MRALPLVVIVMLVLDALLALVDVWASDAEREVLVALQSASLERGISLGRSLEQAAARASLVRDVRVVALVVTAVPFLFWWVRTERAQRREVPERVGPLLEWFLPLANLVLPYRRARRWRPALGTFVWWASWLSAVLLEQLAWRAEAQLDHAALVRADLWRIASAACAALAALSAAHFVAKVSRAS